ncbi:MATE family efflux transporter [bacterium]|nr:MATE family efflux transporter [bacterium]
MSTYNVVDTIFVGQGVGTLGIAGVALVFPFQMIVLALGQLLGMGGASIISRALGAKDPGKANRTLGNLITATVALSIMITIPGEIFIDKILIILGATETTLPYAHQYLRVILLGTLVRTFAIAANNIIRSEGRAKASMFIMVLSAVLNIILDAIFIFVFKMGVAGAALATVVSQTVACFYIFSFFISPKSSLKLAFVNMRPDFKVLGETLAIGLSSLGRNIASSVLIIIMNNALAHHGGAVAIAAFGVINRLTFMFFTPVIGLSQGFQPIVGYNYGSGRLAKVRESVKISIVWSTLICTAGFIIMMIFPDWLIRVFSNDPQLIEVGSANLRIVVALMPVIGFQVIGATMFQAFGHATRAFILTISRQLLILIPLLLILPAYIGITGVAISFPIADLLSAILTAFFVFPAMKKLNRDHPVNIRGL